MSETIKRTADNESDDDDQPSSKRTRMVAGADSVASVVQAGSEGAAEACKSERQCFQVLSHCLRSHHRRRRAAVRPWRKGCRRHAQDARLWLARCRQYDISLFSLFFFVFFSHSLSLSLSLQFALHFDLPFSHPGSKAGSGSYFLKAAVRVGASSGGARKGFGAFASAANSASPSEGTPDAKAPPAFAFGKSMADRVTVSRCQRDRER